MTAIFEGFNRLFSRTLEYALRAMAHLAMREPDAVTASRLAEITKVPAPYLSKVLQQLRDHDLVLSQRGVGGGIRLAREASQITILDVASAVDPVKRIDTCPLGLPGHGSKLCPLHRRMDNALMQIETTFANSSLAELIQESDGITPLCPVPGIDAGTDGSLGDDSV